MTRSYRSEEEPRKRSALLRRILMLTALLGVLASATPSSAQAQQDPEHDALVRALRMQQPSDPMWQAMMQVATYIQPSNTSTRNIRHRRNRERRRVQGHSINSTTQ